MKRYGMIFTLALLLLPLVAACIKTSADYEQAETAAETDVETETVDEDIAEEVRSIGQPVVKQLSSNLLEKVKEAMEEGGPTHAIEFCSTRALEFTEDVEEDAGYAIKRTSTQLRNPENEPDNYEEAALRYFERMMEEEGDLPPDYVQRVSDDQYRYYVAIRLGKPCLTCHGDSAEFSEDLQEALDEAYPNDEATGYEEGDFRGVVRVSVPASEVEE